MKLKETFLPEMYSRGLFDEKTLDLAAEHTDKMYDTLFTGTANLLNSVKSMDKQTAFTITKIEGSLIAAAIVEFFPNADDASKPGNWSFVWTFDEKDIKPDAVVINISNTDTHPFFRAVAGQKWGMRFECESDLIICLGYALEQLKKFLDENAKEGSIVSVEQDGVFQARVSVENGEKLFALEMDGEIKSLIKSDAMIEK